MTQTLTTDELRQIVETDHTQCGDAAAMARELLANREAQPVRYQYREIGEGGWRDCDKAQYDYCQRSPELDARIAPAESESVFPAARDKSQGWKIDPEYLQSIADAVGCSDDEGTPSMEMVEAVLLAAAPPAPAVTDEKAITPFFDTIALDTAKMVMCDVNRRSDFLGGDIQLLARIQCRVDEACRAAMLAQPVSQGCKLADSSGGWIEHDGDSIPKTLDRNALVYLKTRGKELKFPYPAGIVRWGHFNNDFDIVAYKMAAAPEGGND